MSAVCACWSVEPLSVFRRFAHWDAQRLGHTFAVGRIGLVAVADVAELDLLRGITHGAGGVVEEHLLLCRIHGPEQCARLGVVVVIVFAVAPVVGRAIESQRRLAAVRLLLPLTVAVGFIAERAAVIVVYSHGTIAMEAVDRTARTVDGIR